MEEDSKIYLIDENGKSKEYKVLLTFTAKENNNFYVVYTDGSLDEDGYVITYAGIYDKKNDKKVLLPVETDAEWELIDHLLTKLDEEGKNEN
ncbi:MAG: DUF1292 domain-containing protein [Bacilli bacterium]|nr:DUF1292 domain-containing protein [Bacilli bacterium]